MAARKPTPDILAQEEDVMGAVLAAKPAPAPARELIPLTKVRVNGGTQMRAALNEATVEEYREEFLRHKAWGDFPPVILFYDGSDYWVADGFHRIEAFKRIWGDTNPLNVLHAEVRAGSRRDAVLYAAGANSVHGLRRTNADKRRAVETLLRDEEWGKWSDGEVARRCAVAAMTVSRIRGELISNNVIDTPANRTVQRNGTTYTQNTANIGQRSNTFDSAVPAPSVVPSAATGSRQHGAELARCTVCNRPLSDPASAIAGVGPCCASKRHAGGSSNGEPAAAKLLVDWTPDDWAQYERECQAQPEPQLANMGRGLGPKAYRIAALVPDVVEYLRTYQDHLGRAGSELEPKSAAHRNSVFWRDLTTAWANRSIPEDVLMAAIKGAFEDLRREAEFAKYDAQQAQGQPPVVAPVRPSTMAVHFSSETPEHYTPSVIIEAAIACMGGIDLDPCSNSKDAPNVPAAAHYTREDDGLSLPWQGCVYMNPPYGREIDDWVAKLVHEYESGGVTEAIALVPSRTDTQWWQRLREYHVCLVTGRLKFLGNDDPAPFPSAVFYLGPNTENFVDAFENIGDIWHRTRRGYCFGA